MIRRRISVSVPKGLDEFSNEQLTHELQDYLAHRAQRHLVTVPEEYLIRTLIDLAPQDNMWIELKRITRHYNAVMGNDALHFIHSRHVTKMLFAMGFTERKRISVKAQMQVHVHVLHSLLKRFQNKGT